MAGDDESRELTLQHVEVLIDNKALEQRLKTIEILNRSEQKLKDWEEETDMMQHEADKLDKEIKDLIHAEDMIREIKRTTIANKKDLDIAIAANLDAIQVMRKNNIRYKKEK